MKPEALRILIVDDYPDQADEMRRFMNDHEPAWNIDIADGKSSAIALVREAMEAHRAFAVLITDLQMEEDIQNGRELIGAVQEIDPLIMTILYSGHHDELRKIDTSGLDVFDVVFKADDGACTTRILQRTRAAIRFRAWAVRVTFLRRYVDTKLFQSFEDDPAFLVPCLRDVTIVFWDLRGFSAACDRLRGHTNLISGFVTEYGDLAARTIFQHGGLLDKFIGDGVMALFGLLDQTEDGPRAGAIAAVRAAQDLQSGFAALVGKWQPEWDYRAFGGDVDVRLACGIHTGQALVGNLGTSFRDQFTAIGPHVNFAQRIESLAARTRGGAGRRGSSVGGEDDGDARGGSGSGQILLSRATAGFVTPTIRVVPHRKMDNVKNVPGAQMLFRIEPAGQSPAAPARRRTRSSRRRARS